MNKIVLWILIALGIFIIFIGGFLYFNVYKSYKMQSMLDVEIEKPAIYLYPVEDSQIFVKLNINGEIIEDIPEYKDGWNVFATKEGIIEGKYDYLFYEAKLKKISIPKEGWIVEYSELELWFNKNLKLLGLNEKETDQFKEYWLNRLEKSKYYEIKLLSNEFLDENMDLIITPEPETEIRLNFIFKPLKKNYSIKNPEIITPERNGFTVVEWGGILIK
jgi:hypothetical protein